ncbi:DNA polymerase [Rhodococcus phage Toil]|uniref:DNA-directed DNA polymerase n=1 Tax=Rhodococcus phage Toil TaxID=1975614 RepID=A0A1W6DXF9_9VIRU|nr:DNA polymerase [Rhodococcus phage Toil]ARK07690.1 DNA polymerase [Rhodococcus phage Toil]
MTHHGQLTQSYVLLGVSDDSSVRDEVSGRDLSTTQCLAFLIKQEREHPGHIKVAFSFNYDVNMIIKDIPEHNLKRLLDGKDVYYGDYKLNWLSSKWLDIWHTDPITLDYAYTRIYDVFSFFGCSFLKACRQYLGDDPDLVRVEEGKGLRNVFEYSELDSLIKPYMHAELDLMARLANRLRELLDSIDLELRSWHGPGAIATALLSKHKVKRFRPDDEPPEVRTAAQFAYAGGRFESYKTGLYESPVYQYDIRSAYPYALTQCPALTEDYERDDSPTQGRPVPSFSLCRIRYYDNTIDRRGINPFALRSGSGAIYFPNFVETWVWGIEYNAALRHRAEFLELVSTITFYDDGTRPFSFIGDLYDQRAKWKREGNPAQLACKLGMNSCYGKLAQRVGWDEKKMTAPNWHQLRWAGYLTATCRSMVFDAMAQAPDRIIAVETDGIFSEVPLDLSLGSELGQWDHEQFDAIMYVQSGVYFTLEGDDWSTGKTRGFSANKTHAATARVAVETLAPMVTEQNRFHGLRGNIGKADWRSWQRHPHVVTWGGNGKRYHSTECEDCANGSLWHRTLFSMPKSPISTPHALPWLGDEWDHERIILM